MRSAERRHHLVEAYAGLEPVVVRYRNVEPAASTTGTWLGQVGVPTSTSRQDGLSQSA